MKITFIKSVAKPSVDDPKPIKPEVALVGRSNAGKSSLLNAFSRQKVARVSAVPGHTQLLNFFDVGAYYLVDLPGYGYAKRSRREQLTWKKMVERYFKVRTSLVGLILVMDIRRSWSVDEVQLVDWLDREGISSRQIVVVLNKCDKLSRQVQDRQRRQMQMDSQINDIFVVSCKKRQGIKELQKFMNLLG